MRNLQSDLRTLWPYARALWAPESAPPGCGWSTVVADPQLGSVRLTGELRAPRDARALVLIVHGLGGSSTSQHCLRAARCAAEHGLASLCLSLRGADRRGEDFYNVGLREDLLAALASPELARFARLYLLGYSMGGHVVLHTVAATRAQAPLDPRVVAAAALCTPLDLAVAQRHIDSPRAWLYRRHVLAGLKSIYAAVAASGAPLPTPLGRVLAVRTIHEWDRLTIAPRYGYASPAHFYREMALAPHLAHLCVPTLLVASASDPLIPPETIRPFLPTRVRGAPLELRWAPRSGHVAFPRDIDLGLDARGGGGGLESQIYRWFERVGSDAREVALSPSRRRTARASRPDARGPRA